MIHTPRDILHLRRQDLDPVKWDACIDADPNGLIYARSFYLDRMTMGQWDALVMGDYKAVMPLTWNKKMGFYYLFQPFCTPALGIFGDPGPIDIDTDPGLVTAFLQAIPRKFKYWDIDLHEANGLLPGAGNPVDLPHLHIASRVNQFIPLDKGKAELEQGYHRLAQRKCKKALSAGLEIVRDASAADVIDRYRMEYDHIHPRIRQIQYERLTACAGMAITSGNATAYLAKWPHGEVAAFYLVLADDKFVYSWLGGSTKKGKEDGAFYLLTDAAIKDHACTKRIFRFEGSDHPGIASFNTSFGSTPVNYAHLIMNGLPFPFHFLKRSKIIYSKKSVENF